MAMVFRGAIVVSLTTLVLGDGHVPPTSSAELAAQAREEARNIRFAKNTLIALAAIAIAVALYRLAIYSVRHIRTLVSINNTTQRYFKPPSPLFASIKQHILYAPLFRMRHREEYRLLNMNLGILPSRFQCLFFIGVIAMNIAHCIHGIPWDGPQAEMLTLLGNRAGTLSIANMIPLVIMAGRNNPLIVILNISFDTFNAIHRLFGRMVVIQALVHSVALISRTVHQAGWEAVIKAVQQKQMIFTGVVGILALVGILLQSSSVIRHAFYETFLHLHIVLIITVLVALWYHLAALPSQTYLLVVIVAWACERMIRLMSLAYRNIGQGTKVVAEALPGEAVRLDIRLARPWHFRPGQHAFITIPSIGLWTSHPFSVAWSSEDNPTDSEKGLTLERHDPLANHDTTVSLVVRRRTGFTDALFQQARNAPKGCITLNALVEGPYGGSQVLHSYGTVLLFAGGIGITHQVPFVRDLVARFANGTVATRRVCLVWIIQSPEHMEWIRPWMTTILAMDKRRDVLRIQLFITRPRSTKEIRSPSATVRIFPGKPNVDTLVQMECERQLGAMAVSVCGSGGLSDDVRAAVRKRQAHTNIDFFEESFSW